MTKLLARILPKGAFARNVGLLVSGTAFAQGLAVLALPFLTRLYSPEDFSLLAVYVAIIGIGTVVSCLRYNIAIPIPESDTDAIALLIVSLLVATAASLVMALPVLFAPISTAKFLGQPGLETYLWMVPVGIFVASAYNALQFWTSRQGRFGLITRTRIERALGGVGTQVAFGMTTPSAFGLLFGHMIYGGLGVIGLLRDIGRHDRSSLGSISRTRLLQQASRYRQFPIWSTPEALFNTAGVQVPVLLIAAAAAGPEAGFLMLAMRVMGLPMGIVGQSVAQVYLAEAPRRLRADDLSQFTRRTMMKLLIRGAPPIVAIGLLSPFAFPYVFGTEWARAGVIVAWMTPWFVLQFVTSPVSMMLHVTGRTMLAMVLQALGLALRVGPLVVHAYLDPALLPEIFAISSAVFYSVYLLVLLKIIPKI